MNKEYERFDLTVDFFFFQMRNRSKTFVFLPVSRFNPVFFRDWKSNFTLTWWCQNIKYCCNVSTSVAGGMLQVAIFSFLWFRGLQHIFWRRWRRNKHSRAHLLRSDHPVLCLPLGIQQTLHLPLRTGNIDVDMWDPMLDFPWLDKERFSIQWIKF